MTSILLELAKPENVRKQTSMNNPNPVYIAKIIGKNKDYLKALEEVSIIIGGFKKPIGQSLFGNLSYHPI